MNAVGEARWCGIHNIHKTLYHHDSLPDNLLRLGAGWFAGAEVGAQCTGAVAAFKLTELKVCRYPFRGVIFPLACMKYLEDFLYEIS